MNPVLAMISFYLFAATLIACFVTAYLVTRNSRLMIRTFALLGATLSIYLAGYLMEINSETLPEMQFWNQIEYIGVAFYPAAWLILALLYTSRGPQGLSRRLYTLILSVPFAVFLARLTNPWHHLYYAAMRVRETTHLTLMVIDKGPLYYVNGVFNFICAVVPIWLYLRYTEASAARRKGGTLMFTASVIPFIAYIWIISDFGSTGLDYVALSLPVALALVAIALVRYDFLDVHSLARAEIFDKGKDAMILLDAWHQLRDSNRLAKRILPELNTLSERCEIETLLADRPALLHAIRFEAEETAEPFAMDGLYYEIHVTPITGRRHPLEGYLLTMVDVTEKQMARQKLELLATRDALTGLNNRGNFERLTRLAMQQARQSGRSSALVMIDIDHFKRVNDSYGHAVGDAVLRAIGRRMLGFFRVSDIIGRIGGEEFAVFLPGNTLAQAGLLCDRFRETAMAEPIVIDETSLVLTVSIGVAEFTPESGDFEQLLRMSDTALYQAKASGRNRTVLHTRGEPVAWSHRMAPGPASGETAATAEDPAEPGSGLPDMAIGRDPASWASGSPG